MKHKLLILSLLFCGFANAQITVTSTDMPLVNDIVRYSTSATSVSTMLNDTGQNRTWDFTGLVPNFQNLDSFKTALSINILYASFSSSSFGKHDPDISFTLASATSVYSFYSNSSSSFAADGRAFSVSGIPVSQPYIGKDVIYKFPLVYGNSDTSSYYTNSVSLVLANLVSTGKRINIVDGWGVLKTPYGTYNCVRVKSIVQQTDTVQITTPINFSLPVTHNKTEYKWIANGQKIPILEVDVTTGTGAATTIKYRDSVRPEAFNGLAKFGANKTLFPVNSPGDTCKLTDSSLNKPNSVEWTITPNTFQFEPGYSSTSPVTKVYFTAGGTYTVKLHAVYNAGTSDTTKVNYITVLQGPTANFGSSIKGSTNPLTVVFFYDSSTGTPLPTAWQWTFVPNKVSYVGGTSSTSQNPKITFDSIGTYSVSLKVTDSIGSNTITKNNYVVVFNTGLNDIKQKHQTATISPNPADDYFVVEVNQSAVDHIELFDITGKSYQADYAWKDQNYCSVDCAQMNAGIYFLKIVYNDGQTEVKRICVR